MAMMGRAELARTRATARPAPGATCMPRTAPDATCMPRTAPVAKAPPRNLASESRSFWERARNCSLHGPRHCKLRLPPLSCLRLARRATLRAWR